MKTHTTNCTNTFIAVAEDSPAEAGTMPPVKGEARSVANMQFDMLYEHPYIYTSDDVIFTVYADRNDIKKSDRAKAREVFFSKGQPCMRTSPLTKRHGWGVHADEEGRIAIYGCETPEYKRMEKDKKLALVKAMKSSR